MQDLFSLGVLVETPFIHVIIGDYIFGAYLKHVSKTNNLSHVKNIKEIFPDYVTSIDIVKTNGTVNNYSLTLNYVISPGDDPNKIDRILSNVSQDRKIVFSYGDCSMPASTYREEEGIITGVTLLFSVENSTITYTITAVSSVKLATANIKSYPKLTKKPSDVIKTLLRDPKSGLLDIFTGMRQTGVEHQLIAGDDKQVEICALMNTSVLDYLNYLVSCMQAQGDTDNRHKYTLVCMDDIHDKYHGPYFKVVKIANNIQETNSLETYELNIGYPDATPITNFTINSSDGYAILYNYSVKQSNSYDTVYTVDSDGKYLMISEPSIFRSSNTIVPSEADKTWWSQMTQYPISAELTVKGLLRPAILMTYVKINVLFYGRKHSSSGTYIITKQRDSISDAGYRSTLSLTRILGELL